MSRTEPRRRWVAPYLTALAIAAPATQLLVWLSAGQPPAGAGDWSFFVAGPMSTILLAIWLVPVALWVVSSSRQRPDRWLVGFGALVLAVWGAWCVLSLVRGDELDLSVFLVPAIVGMLLLKPPTFRATVRAATAFSWALVAITLLTLMADLAARRPPGWEPVWGDPVLAARCTDMGNLALEVGDGMSRFSITNGLGLGARWGGPFQNPNYLGMVAAWLVVFGWWRRGLPRFLLVGFGLVFFALCTSRTSFLAALAGVAVLLVASRPRGSSRFGRRNAGIAVGVLALGVVVAVPFVSPTVNGRTVAWEAILDLWRDSPWLGAGTSGIQAAIEACQFPAWAPHGHSMVIDALGRRGILGLVPVLLVVGIVIALAVRAIRRGQPVGLALLASFIVIGLTDHDVDWTQPTYRWMFLFLPTVMSWAWTRSQQVPPSIDI